MTMNKGSVQDNKADAIKSIRDEIDVLHTKMAYIKSIDFNTFKPNEKQWHRIMETPVRNNPVLVSHLIKNLVPEATMFHLGANYAHFNVNGVSFGYSTSRGHALTVFGAADKYTSLSEDRIEGILDTIAQVKESLQYPMDVSFCNTKTINALYQKQGNELKYDRFVEFMHKHQAPVELEIDRE